MVNKFEKFVQAKLYVKFETKKEELSYWGNAFAGEAGEVCNEIKKEVRDNLDRTERIKSEMGDVLFYLSAIANNHGFTLDDAMFDQITKLSDIDNNDK